jgi:hypothetical protein
MKLSTFFATVAVAFADIVADDVCVSNGQEVSCDAPPAQPIVSFYFFPCLARTHKGTEFYKF